jgi:hypothetical protein
MNVTTATVGRERWKNFWKRCFLYIPCLTKGKLVINSTQNFLFEDYVCSFLLNFLHCYSLLI